MSESKSVMTRGEVDRAERRALAIFDRWHRVTGYVPEHCLCEVEGCVRDAVHVGIQAAMGIYEPLEGERE